MADFNVGDQVRARNRMYDFTGTVLEICDEEITVVIGCDECGGDPHEVDFRDVDAEQIKRVVADNREVLDALRPLDG